MPSKPRCLGEREADVKRVRDKAMPKIVSGDVAEVRFCRGRLNRAERVPLAVRLAGRRRERKRVSADRLDVSFGLPAG